MRDDIVLEQNDKILEQVTIKSEVTGIVKNFGIILKKTEL